MTSHPIRGIALVGPPGSGKTTIADELSKLLGWERRSFATALKDELADALDTTTPAEYRVYHRDYRDGMTYLDQKENYRPLLQAWGVFRRGMDPDYWVKHLLRSVDDDQPFIVDDCRFPNEYDMLVDRGFAFVRLAPGETVRELTLVAAGHESEIHWPKFNVDLELSYEAGPGNQALRIAEYFNFGWKSIDNEDEPIYALPV